MSQDITIIEVGPRDGLQNEKAILSLEQKKSFIEGLVRAGLKVIEATSFVRADKIPQMGDASELYPQVSSLPARLPCLIPNMKGLEEALKVGVKEIALFTASSETFNQKNINCSIDESFERFKPVAKKALDNGLSIRGYVSTVFGCPYEGKTSLKKTVEVGQRLFDLGVHEISLGDTIGVGNPNQVKELMKMISAPLEKLAMHFHDTHGLGLCNVLTSLELGITKFDSSAAGLGGCPYAHGATGNLATEDLVYLCESLGLKTGVNFELLAQTSKKILNTIGKTSGSKHLTAYLKGQEND